MTATYDRLAAAHPDRVGGLGYWADLDGYVVDVTGSGNYANWSLSYTNGPFIAGGRTDSVDAAWRAGCDALDEQQALTAQLVDLDTEAAS